MTAPIIIVGGGPVGAVLALLLAKAGIPVKVLEARPQGASHSDQRALALSFGSRRLLDKLGIWQDLMPEATPIQTIHVSQKGSLGRTLLKAGDYQQEALGYVLSYGALSAALEKALAELNHVETQFQATAEYITQDDENASVSYRMDGEAYLLESKLVVLADGGRSVNALVNMERDTKDYGHDALVTKVVAELPHRNIAYERFTADGPIALLPNGERAFSLVWTGKKELIAPLLTLDDDTFLTQFQAQFGDRVGKFLSVEKRMSFPLTMSRLQHNLTPHLVVIGNAAQTMHPVAGQGFNVGLRDAESLAKHILSSTADLGALAMLQAYQASRQRDTKGGLKFTDFLVNTFSNDLLGVSALRSMGLGMLDVLKPVKKQLVSKMSFGK